MFMKLDHHYIVIMVTAEILIHLILISIVFDTGVFISMVLITLPLIPFHLYYNILYKIL